MENYEKIRVVGRGAYGTVHLCKRLSDKKNVIIKQIPVEQMTKEERQSALNEVKVLSMLNHPNIIEYYENFLEDKALMIVMEYAQGGTLLDFLQMQNNRLLEEEEILHFFAQLLLSIQHVHSKQVLHRDLKTQNILLDKKKRVVKIGDFGISKVLSSKSKAYTVVGTPCYISPELCEGKPYNQKSDIWALGCVLYELASLKRAFEAANLPALILKIMRGTFSPIAEHYSEELRALILSMLHLDPNKRPDINQIMSLPILINAIMNLHTEMGKIPCAKTLRPITPGIANTARSRSRGSSASVRDSIQNKPQALSSVYCWGGGINMPTKLPLPTNDTQVVEVSAGRTQKAAVTKNGRLFTWESPGVGSESMLPGSLDHTAIPGFVPKFLEGQSAVAIQHVACGDLFTACLTDRGILMTYGSGANGCLGHGNLNDVTQAKIVEALLGYEIVQVSCGASHVLAVTNENEVFSWGRGDNGRLGLGTLESHTTPQPVEFPDGVSPCYVNCGVDCSMVITLDNKLFCCGNNRYNKCCLDDNNQEGVGLKSVEEVRVFTRVASPPIGNSLVKTVSMGTSHSAIVTVDGELYTCGANPFGQLGYRTDFNSKMAGQVVTVKDHKVTMVACGDTFTVAVTQDGEVFSFGKSARGRLGRSDNDNMTPKRVIVNSEDVFAAVSISCSHGTTLFATKPVHGVLE